MFWLYRSKVAPTTRKGTLAVVPAADFWGKAPGRQLPRVQNACHPFYAGFRVICWMHRLAGCCFLENLWSSDAADVRARRISPYLLYPLCIWFYLNLVNITMLVDVEEHKQGMRPAEELNRSIFLTFFLVLNLESALNDALLLLQAPKLVDLLRMCELIELHTAVPPYVRRQTLRFAWALVAFQVTETILYVALTAYSGFGTSLLVEEGRQIAPFRMGLAVSNGFVGVPYLALMNTSTRLLVTYFSQTIALYLGCIYRNTDRCLRSRRTPESRKVLLVDQVRVQLSLIKNCVDMVSTLVGPSLLYAYAYSVAILCVSAYYTIIPEQKLPVRIFFFFFALLHFLSIVLPPIMAQRMNTAVCELRTVVQGVLMEDCSDELMVQLRMMLSIIKKEDLKFSGCGFFVVDLPTFADLMGAVITYTVVLVQTNESYARGSLEHSSNVTVA
ncbi:uncharacterized protein LOC144103772 [Amblyomma americanum]